MISTERKLDEDCIRLIAAFEALTGVSVRDCIIDEGSDAAYMLVEEGKLGLAIGKGGKNIKRVEEVTKKRIKLYEFSNDIYLFAKRLVPCASKITLLGKVLEIDVERRDRAVVIGRDGKNLNLIKAIFQRNFGIHDVIIR